MDWLAHGVLRKSLPKVFSLFSAYKAFYAKPYAKLTPVSAAVLICLVSCAQPLFCAKESKGSTESAAEWQDRRTRGGTRGLVTKDASPLEHEGDGS